MPDNVYKLKDNIFVCRTQAGFKKAIRTFAESNVIPHNFPKTYPCLVVFNWHYTGGGHVLCCSFLPMSTLRDVVEKDAKETQELKDSVKVIAK